MCLFLLGVSATLLVLVVIHFLYKKAIAYCASMYKAGYDKSQKDDTAQLLMVVKELPPEYAAVIWKKLTGADLPSEKKDEVSSDKVITGFTPTKEVADEKH